MAGLDAWSLSLLRMPEGALPLDAIAAPVWDLLCEEAARAGVPVEVTVRVDDAELRTWLEGRGCVAGDVSWSGWMAAERRPEVRALPAGYRLVDRLVRKAEIAPEHPMGARNGAAVEARLRHAALYDPRLDFSDVEGSGRIGRL